MGSHIFTYHLTQVNLPHLTTARQVGSQFTYPGGMEGSVVLSGWLYTEMVYLSADTHPSSNRAWCGATVLLETSVLTTTPHCHPSGGCYKVPYGCNLRGTVTFHIMLNFSDISVAKNQ